MKVYHIEFAKVGLNTSGGEECMLKVIRYLKSRRVQNILLTTDNAKETYIKRGLKKDRYLDYQIIHSYKNERKYHLFISYLIRTFQATKLVKKIELEQNDILMCHSDVFPNSIPFRLLAKRNPNSKLFYWYHMICPNIFRGFKGQYTKRLYWPNVRLIFFKLSQILFDKLLLPKGIIITINPFYRSILKKKFPHNRLYVSEHHGGADIPKINSMKKRYDLVWMGRFHEQKGLLEVPYIIKYVSSKKLDLRFLLLGGGNKDILGKFNQLTEKLSIKQFIFYRGFVKDDMRFRLLYQSKIFLMTSFYESLGSVNIEAMKCGVPVVAYNLPVFKVFEAGMVKIPTLDNKAMAKQILKMIEDKKYYHNLRNEAMNFSRLFDWDRTCEKIYILLKGE